MPRKRTSPFNHQTFLTKVGSGKTLLQSRKKDILFSQGDAVDAVFYLQQGKVKLTVVTKQGKEAVLAILERGSFFGEGLAGQPVRMATVTVLEDSSIVRIDKQAMITVAPQGTHIRGAIHRLSAVSQHSHRRRLGGSIVQFQRETAGARPSTAVPLWERRQA